MNLLLKCLTVLNISHCCVDVDVGCRKCSFGTPVGVVLPLVLLYIVKIHHLFVKKLPF